MSELIKLVADDPLAITDELVRAVDRVCVFENGAIKETLTGDNITVERLRASVQA